MDNMYGIKVGDIFYKSWGYDQTNVNFYQVIRVTAKKAEVRPIGSKAAEMHGAGGNRVVPNPDYTCEWDVLIGVEQSDERKSKVCTVTTGYHGEPSIVLRSGQYRAHPWHGGSLYETDSLSGH